MSAHIAVAFAAPAGQEYENQWMPYDAAVRPNKLWSQQRGPEYRVFLQHFSSPPFVASFQDASNAVARPQQQSSFGPFLAFSHFHCMHAL